MELDKLITRMEDARKHAEDLLPKEYYLTAIPTDAYWQGYSDALGELLEYIEDNKDK